MNSKPARAKSFLLASAALCVTVLVTLVLAEIVLRLTGVQSSLVYQPNPYYGWGHTPGSAFDWTTDGDIQHIAINALGLRDDDFAYLKPARKQRILVLGDSFAEGFQVSLDERFSNLIADELNSRQPDAGVVYEVINAGVSGYGTDNELLFYRHEGYKYDSDLVILAFYVGNDVRNNWYTLENIDTGGFRKPYFELSGDRLELREYPFLQHTSVSTRTKTFLNEHLVLYSFFREIRDRIRHGRVKALNSGSEGIPLDFQFFDRDFGAEWLTAFQVTNALLRELQVEVAAHGSKLLVVLIPSRFQVNVADWQKEVLSQSGMRGVQWDLEQPNRLLGDILSANKIDYLDLLPLLRTAAERRDADLYISGDGHWNAAGHNEAALQIARWIASNEFDAAQK